MNESGVLCDTNWVMDPDSNRDTIISIACIQIFVTLTTLFVNAIEIIVVWNAEECVGTKKAILLNLCVSDFLHGLITQVVYITFLVLQLYGRTVCFLAKASMSFCLVFTHVSILGLWLASTERYLCIVHPFVHQRYLHSRVWGITISMVWCVSIFVALLHRFYNRGSLTLVVSILVSCMCIGLMYTKIACVVVKARKEIHQQHASVGSVDQGRRQSAKLFAMLILLTIICYAPFSYCVLVTKIGATTQSEKIVLNWLWTLLTFSSVLNPICYCLMNKTLRRKCLQLFKIDRSS